MTPPRFSERESLQWLDWLLRIRWLLLFGVCISMAAGASLLYLDVPVRGSATVALLVVSIAAPYLVVAVTLFKTVSMACSIADVLREREQQLASGRKVRARPAPEREVRSAVPPPTDAVLATAPAAATKGPGLASEAGASLQLAQADLALLSEAFTDILPVLDQHDVAGPRLRVARLEYPFFRAQVPLLLQDVSAALVRVGAALREAAPVRQP